MKLAALDRPFAPSTLARAREIVKDYCIIIEQHEDVGFLGSSLEIPTVLADGATPESCVASTVDALVATVATMLEDAQHPPSPVRACKRERQIKLRVNIREKAVLENAALRRGFRSVSDFMRYAALEASTK